MRQRERDRIARRRADYRAANLKLERTNARLEKLGNKGKQGKGRRVRDELRQQVSALYSAAQMARGRLTVAISRPVEARIADIRSRPKRHRPGAIDKLQPEFNKAKEAIKSVQAPTEVSTVKAMRLVQMAIDAGVAPADGYRKIAASAGISGRLVYWMMKSPDKFGISPLEGEEID
jgi:hypothetical protein